MARKHLRHDATRRQDGYLCDVPIGRLLDSCRAQRISGTLRIESWGLAASIEWHQGEVREASLGALRGAAAVRELGFVRDGSFALRTEQPVCLDAPVPVRTAEPLAGTVAVTRAARPAPPPLPARTQPARGQIVRPQLAVPAWPQYAYAVTAQARPAPAMSRLRLPSVTLSLGILCLTMFCSLLAIQL